MFSATKLFGLAAAVALLGVMVVGRPFAEQTPPTPAAIDTDPGTVSMYRGTVRGLEQHDPGTIEVFDWGSLKEGERWTGQMEMDDPRLSGVIDCYSNAFITDRGAGWLRAMSCRVSNTEGSWQAISRGYMAPRGGGIHDQLWMEGEGAYSGLYAIQRCDMSALTATVECEGAVFQGGFPDAPAEAPAAPTDG